jgi:hypothetical protein
MAYFYQECINNTPQQSVRKRDREKKKKKKKKNSITI